MNKKLRCCGVLLEYNKTYLLGRTSGEVNIYSIPKGRQEDGESDADTALRELAEETAIQIKKSYFPTEPFISYKTDSGKKVVVFKVILDKLPRNEKWLDMMDNGNEEFASFLWVTKAEGLSLVKNHMKKIFEAL